MRSYSVSLEQMLSARERRAAIQRRMISGNDNDHCLVCLTMNIAGDVKRTPMTRMLFSRGVSDMESLGLRVQDRLMIDEVTGSEAFWLLEEDGKSVKRMLEAEEDSFPAARLFDFDVIIPDGTKLSRTEARRCLICDAPAAECARSRRHGLEAVIAASDRLLRDFCADTLAKAAYDSLLDELYTTPKPGLVDRMSLGAHSDMDIPLFEKSALSLVPYFRDAVRMGIDHCDMGSLRARGKEAEDVMFAATGGVNTHKGLIYSMGLLLAGMGMCLAEGGECTAHASELARQDADIQLRSSLSGSATNGGAVYRSYGAKGATGEAAEGFPDAVYCLSRLTAYRASGSSEPAALALCDCMAVLEDTNLLHRGGPEGLAFVRQAASAVSSMPEEERTDALRELDTELIRRNLSPGGSADMLALALLLERWQALNTQIHPVCGM